MPIPAACACRWTVDSSHCSDSLRGVSITCAPVARLAIHFDASSEMKEPPNPKITANSSNCPLLPNEMPFACSTDRMMLNSPSTARLVAKNNATRLNIGVSVAPRTVRGYGH